MVSGRNQKGSGHRGGCVEIGILAQQTDQGIKMLDLCTVLTILSSLCVCLTRTDSELHQRRTQFTVFLGAIGLQAVATHKLHQLV